MRLDLRRYLLLRVDALCWPRVLERTPAWGRPEMPPASLSLLRSWAERGWPLIVRRYRPDEPRDVIPVAVSLPPRPQRTGATLSVLDAEVAGIAASAGLCPALDLAPPAWRATLQQLMAIGAHCGSEPVLHGSLMWQMLTGECYLTARSDLDVCWPVTDTRQAQTLVEALARIQGSSAVRIDGELLLPGGGGVAWREFADRGVDEVLVKTLHAVSTRARDCLFAAAAPAA